MHLQAEKACQQSIELLDETNLVLLLERHNTRNLQMKAAEVRLQSCCVLACWLHSSSPTAFPPLDYISREFLACRQ